MRLKKIIVLLCTIAICAGLNFCGDPALPPPPAQKKDSLVYLNHSDTARYVGMNTCRLCHQGIYNTFIKTGMGKSIDLATRTKSSGIFPEATVYDDSSGMSYHAFWAHDSLYMKEYRLHKKDTEFVRTERVSFIIGSGQHTNSHLQLVNGYVHQMPMTFYTQKKKWALPPGFENGMNTHFSRKIGLECMSCHNGYPGLVMGSENKYTAVPTGIDCERCHGPGSIHVAQRQNGSKVDTAKYIDYSIVNPAKLPIDAQFDVCQRCHLQGNAVLKEGKSFYDFRPGKKLSDVISVFLPKYSNADDEFIMASHADRLKQSQCFIQSYQQAGSKDVLRPYKGAMTCVTCHNPHVSVRETNKNVFNDACNNCHNQKLLDKKRLTELKKANCGLQTNPVSNCVSCHMPVSGSIDIPHVSVHDHYIRKPITETEKGKIKTFAGLFSINEKNPDALTRAKAYLNQYDKFEQKPQYLDSAEWLLGNKKDLRKNCHALLQLYFVKENYGKMLFVLRQLNEQRCFDSAFVHQSYDNQDAWTCYRVGEAYYNSGQIPGSVRWFKRAVELAPYHLDFRNKYGTALAGTEKTEEAIAQFTFILSENPNYVQAYSNLGYLKLVQGFPAQALKIYTNAQKLDPDNEPLLLNLAGYYMYMGDRESAKKYLNRIISKNPQNLKAKAVLRQMGI